MKINIYDQNYDYDIEVNDRKMITSSTALGILRHKLARNIGIDRIKGFLISFGWEMGVNDAKQALKTDISIETLIKQGPTFHIMTGHIRGFTHECKAEFDDNQNILSFLGKGTWIDSYEAIEHIKRLGISDTQVCHTLIGYSSGFMSTICNEPILAKELTCVGKGDSVCSWMTRTQKEWENDMQEELHFYNETPIMKELEYTYEQLLEQQTFVTKLSNFQKKLTEEISNGSDLQTIAQMVYQIIQIPIIIEDTDYRTITYAGLSEDQYLNLKNDMDQYIQERKEKQRVPYRNKTCKTPIQERLITPILVQKEVLGHCSFIYDDMENDKPKEDYLFLDRFANAASLILLNEKTKFESFERMKGNFLEQILDSRFPASEIINRGKYTGLDLSQPYHIIIIEYKKSAISIEEEFVLQEKILETTFRYFNEKKQNILVSQREGNLILFLTKEIKESKVYDVIKECLNYLMQKYPKSDFKCGISNEGVDITAAVKHYEEAVIALRLAIRKKIVPFRSLGIVGVLINSKNINEIKIVAENELGPLHNMKDPKVLELLQTLYIYLLNGGKLEQTMNDLAISLSGLRYRIKKIENLLEKDLRNPNETHQILLILESLIALGELKLDKK